MDNTLDQMSLAKRQMMVGRISRLSAEGYDMIDICQKLNLSESTVHSIMRIIYLRRALTRRSFTLSTFVDSK